MEPTSKRNQPGGESGIPKEVNLALNVLISAIDGLQIKNDEITVSFRLIGDWKHGSSGHASYVNWIKTKAVKGQ